ncbi:Lipocalin-like domain-containing protein [Aspergillus carlsbadensis]|nr:Lipocalin-like domain-containing protein [Aspergillus carlsbadensis]
MTTNRLTMTRTHISLLVLTAALTWLACKTIESSKYSILAGDPIPRPSPLATDEPLLPDELLGAWTLCSYSLLARSPLGLALAWHPFGKTPSGFLIYSSDSYMAAQLAQPDRAPFASDKIHFATEAEDAAAAKGYMAYVGRFTVHPTGPREAVVEHHVEASLFPNWVGGTQTRVAALRGGTLVIRPVIAESWMVCNLLSRCNARIC